MITTVAESLVYTVADMSCGHCESAVATAVGVVVGVESVRVDLEAKRVVVTGVGLSDEAVRAAIADAGYEAA